MNDPDIMPCGFIAYMREKGLFPYKKMTQFDPPKGVNRSTFTWESYLEKSDSNSVPFELFSEVNFRIYSKIFIFIFTVSIQKLAK